MQLSSRAGRFWSALPGAQHSDGAQHSGREFIPRYRRQDLWIALVVCDWLAPVYVCVPLLITFRMGFCAIKLDAVFHKEIRRNKAHAV